MAEFGAALRGDRPKLTARQKQWFDKLCKVEPGLKLSELATHLGEPYATVQRWAAFFGYLIRDGRMDRPARVDWSTVNWDHSNVMIARDLNVSRERVRQVRGQSPTDPEKSLAQRFAKFVKSHGNDIKTLKLKEIIRASRLNITAKTARQVLAELDSGPSSDGGADPGFDWRLPNRDLAEIHQISVQQVANLRFRFNAGPAKWDARGGRLLTDPVYLSARREESRRAAPRKQKSQPGVRGPGAAEGNKRGRKPRNP